MDPQNATPDTGGFQPEGQQLEETTQVEATDQEAAEQVIELTDEDYKLNFLGTDKFDLSKETPEEVRQALKNLEKSLNKGWTEKNMKFSEERKQFQERLIAAQQELAQKEQAQKATIKDYARREALQDRLSEYDGIDWRRWNNENPQAAQSAWMEYEILKGQHSKLSDEISQKEAHELQRQQQQTQEWLVKSQERLRQKFPDWDSQKSQQIAEFVAKTYLDTGNQQIDLAALQAVVWHPGLTEMAREANLYRDSMKKATEQPKTPPAVPVTKVGGAAPVAKDPEKLPMKDWMKWREEELAAKARKPRGNSIKFR